MAVSGTTVGILTTGDLARALMVAPRTVTKWIDSGRLPGWRLPGSLDRRVLARDAARFAAEAGMPPEVVRGLLLAGGARGVLLASPLADGAARLGDALGPAWHVSSGADAFEAGAALASLGRAVAAAVAWGGCGLHLPELGDRVRRAGPDALLVAVGAGDLAVELAAAGWLTLPADAGWGRVANTIREGVR